MYIQSHSDKLQALQGPLDRAGEAALSDEGLMIIGGVAGWLIGGLMGWPLSAKAATAGLGAFAARGIVGGNLLGLGDMPIAPEKAPLSPSALPPELQTPVAPEKAPASPSVTTTKKPAPKPAYRPAAPTFAPPAQGSSMLWLGAAAVGAFVLFDTTAKPKRRRRRRR